MSNVIERIEKYRAEYAGDDKTVIKFGFDIEEIKEIGFIIDRAYLLLQEEKLNNKQYLLKLEKIIDILQTESNDWIGDNYIDAFKQIKRIFTE